MESVRKINALMVDDDTDFLWVLAKLIDREFPSDVDMAVDCTSAREAFGRRLSCPSRRRG
jgi:DNA-binding NtrC family response regulator